MSHPPHLEFPAEPAGNPFVSADPAAAILSVVPVPVVVLDSDSLDVLSVSRGMTERTGLRADQLVGRNVFDELVPRAEQFALQSAVRTVREDGAATVRTSLGGRAGEGPVPWTCHLVAGPVGGAQRIVLTLVDERPPLVTRAASAPDAQEATVLTDALGVVTAASAGVTSLLGCAVEELVGRPFPLEVFDPEQIARRAEAAERDPGLGLLLLDPTRFDRRANRQVDLGELDRRGDRRDDRSDDRRGDRRGDRRDRRGSTRPSEGAVDWTFVHRDGTRVVVAVRVAPLTDDAGRTIGYRATGTDVTEERRTHQLLVSAVIREREAVRRLAELDQIQRDFIGRASHELRTPLTSMLGYTEMLFESGDNLSPDDRSFVEAIARNAGRLHTLVEDLLVLSRAEAMNDAAPTERVDLAAVVRGARDLVAELSDNRDLVVMIDVPDRAVPVEGDAAQLERIVVNLVSNAVKYTRDGGEVGCSLAVEGDQATLVVADTGIGMSAADLEQVFTPFFRTGAVEADRIRGTGLGLAIVRQLVERHRGEVSVVSVEGLGSTFTVTLPLAVV